MSSSVLGQHVESPRSPHQTLCGIPTTDARKLVTVEMAAVTAKADVWPGCTTCRKLLEKVMRGRGHIHGTPNSDILEMWVVYDHPTDYPDKYVARLHQVLPGGAYGATNYALVCSDLEVLRQGLPSGLVRIERSPGDDPKILETWM